MRKRGLATGITSCGGGVGGAAWSVIAQKLIATVGLPWTYRILGRFIPNDIAQCDADAVLSPGFRSHDAGIVYAGSLHLATGCTASTYTAAIRDKRHADTREEHLQVEHVLEAGLDVSHSQLAVLYSSVLPPAVW